MHVISLLFTCLKTREGALFPGWQILVCNFKLQSVITLSISRQDNKCFADGPNVFNRKSLGIWSHGYCCGVYSKCAATELEFNPPKGIGKQEVECPPNRFLCLTHWGRETHLCVRGLTSIGSDNGLSPGRRQAIIWTDAGISSIRPQGTNFSEISIAIQTFYLKKMRLKMSSGKCRPFCLGLNVLKNLEIYHAQMTW